MLRKSYRGAAIAALAMGVFVAACGTDTTLGPADAACTAGSLSTSAVRTGEISASDCSMWGDWMYEMETGESWTLRTAKDRVYIIRLTPVAAGGDPNTLDAELYLYGRNDAGDAVMLSGSNYSFGVGNVSGGVGRELIVPSHAAATYSVRIALNDPEDFGHYEIETISCPLVTVATGATSAAVALDDECTSLGAVAATTTPVAFFAFKPTAGTVYRMTGTRTAGTSELGMVVRGVGVDFGCYLDNCFSTSTTGAGPLVLDAALSTPGAYTVMLYRATAGTISASFGLALAPVPLMAPTSLQR